MSCYTYGNYYALITSPHNNRRLLRSFSLPTIQNILDAAAEVGICGAFVMSAETHVIIGDEHALRLSLEQTHRLVVVESLDAVDCLTKNYSREEPLTMDLSQMIAQEDPKGEHGDKLRELRAQFIYVVRSFNNFLQQNTKKPETDV